MPVTAPPLPQKDGDTLRLRSLPQRPTYDPPPPPTSGRHLANRFSYSPLMSQRVTPPPSPTLPDPSPVPTGRTRTVSDPQTGAEPPQVSNQSASTSILRRKVLSKETVRQYQEKALQRQGSREGGGGRGGLTRNTHSAMLVPWEKEVSKEGLLGPSSCLGQGKSSGAAAIPDPGLLEEIESMCCLGSGLQSGLDSGLQVSQVHVNNSHQVQSKASDE